MNWNWQGTPVMSQLTRLSLAFIILVLTAIGAEAVESQRFGGGGGTRTKLLDCGKSALAVGYFGRAGSWIDAVGLICRRVKGDGNLGTTFHKSPVGGRDGFARDAKCPEGKVLGGSGTYYGSFVHTISVHCFDWNSAALKTSGPVRPPTTRFGATREYGAARGNFSCPDNNPIQAMRVKYGSYVDSVKFTCRQVRKPSSSKRKKKTTTQSRKKTN